MSEPKAHKLDKMDRAVGIDVVRLTEGAARSAGRFMGRGEEHDVFSSAIDGFMDSLKLVNLRALIAQGEVTANLVNKVEHGEELGEGQIGVDIAIHAVECLTACALGGRNAMSALVVAPRHSLQRTPDVYMDKIACGPDIRDAISFDMAFAELLPKVARAKGVALDELTVTILDRPRNRDWIVAARQAGARVRLIADGDLAAAIATCVPTSGVDLLVGSGGAFEGMLAAAALRGLGGGFMCRYVVKNEEDHRAVLAAGYEDPRKVLTVDDLLPSEFVFSATGITDGDVLRGVQYRGGAAITESLMVRTASQTVRWIRSEHALASGF